jgi:hypothetical protein
LALPTRKRGSPWNAIQTSSERGEAIRTVLRLFGYADAAELARSG